MNDVQTQLFVAVIVAVIVALMCSASRGVRSFQIRLWLYGWGLLLLHSVVAVAVVPPLKGAWLLAVVTVEVAILGLAATVFVIAAMERYHSAMRRRMAAIVAVPWVAFMVGKDWHWGGNPLLYVCIVVGFLGSAMLAAFSSSLPGRSYKPLSAVLLACGAAGAVYGVSQGKPDIAMYMALTTLFTQAAIVTWQESSRTGTGIITTTIALIACGAIFPLFIVTYKLGFRIHYVAWNIPKLFLAFGMLLTIMENERALAVAAGSRFRAFFDQAQEGIIIFRPDTETILEVNPCACAMYGVSRAQLVGSNLVGITKDPAAGARELKKVVETGETTNFATTHFRADRSEINILANGRLIEYEGGPAVLGQMRDVTERKRAEEEWRASEVRYRSLFDNMLNGFAYIQMIFDGDQPVDFVYLNVNHAFETATGLMNVAGKRVTEVVPGIRETNPELFEIYGRVARTGVPERFETSIEAIKVWLSIWAYCSGPDHVAVLFEVITERKRAEEALRESEARLREYERTVQGLDEMIAVVDREYRYRIANHAFLKYHGLTNEELIRHPISDVLGSAAFERVVKAKLDECFQGRIVKYEMNYVYPELGKRNLLISYFPIEGPAGIDRAACVLRDITERKVAEEYKRGLTARMLRMQDEERRRIARELHDTTAQNLAGLCLNLSRLSRSATHWSDKERESLATCRNIADQSLSELRTVSYLLHPPLLEELGLEPALRWFVEGFSKRSGIQVSLDLAAGLTRLPIDMELTLFRIIQESLGNVHRHSGSKVATVRIQLEGGVVLEVADEGFGMAQNWEATLRTIAHQGVGIAGMRERIHQLGGDLRISPRKPKGTIVRAFIPLQEVVPDATDLDR
jgi:PAS domain S-box-containing protein